MVKQLRGQITFKELLPPMNWKDKRGGVPWISGALRAEADHHYSHDTKQRQMGEKGPASPSSCPPSPISVFHGVKPCKYQWTKGPGRYSLQDSAVWQRKWDLSVSWLPGRLPAPAVTSSLDDELSGTLNQNKPPLLELIFAGAFYHSNRNMTKSSLI